MFFIYWRKVGSSTKGKNKRMKTKKILIELLEYLEKYELENSAISKPLNTSDFIGFLNANHKFKGVKRDSVSGGIDDWRAVDNYTTGTKTDISILVVMLFRYAKGYIKKALKNSKIKSADDFSFLVTLMTYESMTKMQLINIQAMEKTSGNEIINRLVRLGFINQWKDQHDRRSVRIAISEMGRAEMYRILPNMKMVAEIVVGDLSPNEMNTFAYLLRSLDNYHKDIFENKRNSDLQDLIKG